MVSMAISDGLIWSIFISAIISLSYSVTLKERSFVDNWWIGPHIRKSAAVSLSPITRLQWIVLGDEITEDEQRMENMTIERYNRSWPLSTTAEIFYSTKNGTTINYILAVASRMQGFVSVEKGGIGHKWVTIKYTSENGTRDQLYVLIESYKIANEPRLIVEENSAKTLTTVIVMDEIRNWTEQILQQDSENFNKIDENL